MLGKTEIVIIFIQELRPQEKIPDVAKYMTKLEVLIILE